MNICSVEISIFRRVYCTNDSKYWGLHDTALPCQIAGHMLTVPPPSHTNNISIHFCLFLFQFLGAPCGQHGPYTFYKAFKYSRQGKTKILSLGEFFFVKILDDASICIAELQLLWQDRNNEDLQLSSTRLYFLPETTPDGRLPHHGEVS